MTYFLFPYCTLAHQTLIERLQLRPPLSNSPARCGPPVKTVCHHWFESYIMHSVLGTYLFDQKIGKFFWFAVIWGSGATATDRRRSFSPIILLAPCSKGSCSCTLYNWLLTVCLQEVSEVLKRSLYGGLAPSHGTGGPLQTACLHHCAVWQEGLRPGTVWIH